LMFYFRPKKTNCFGKNPFSCQGLWLFPQPCFAYKDCHCLTRNAYWGDEGLNDNHNVNNNVQLAAN
jgi:hypothetical protein